jgi:hypothetical protein
MKPTSIEDCALTVRKTSTAWAPFALLLAKVLERLAEDQFLVISVKDTSRFVQFAGQGTFGLRAEVTSNHFLSPAEQLDSTQVAQLGAMGWLAPTGTPDAATPERDPDGSPNWHVDWPAPVEWSDVAEMAVQTLAKVIGVLHPSRLRFVAFDAEGSELDFPSLGLRRAQPAGSTQSETDAGQMLLAIVRTATGLENLAHDQDGDIPVRYGSVAAFVRFVDDPPRVRFHALMLDDVEPSPEVLVRLNELNAAGGPVRFFLYDLVIVAYAEIPAAPCVSEIVANTLHAFVGRCDGLGPELRRKFGGRLRPGCDTPVPVLH